MSIMKPLLLAAALAAGIATPAKAEIVIGLATALTGPVAAIGEQARRGTEAAIERINARGGVLGRKLRLEIADDACDPKQAVAVANQLVTRKVAAVLGHLCSGASIAAADVYAEDGIVMITASATNPTLTERGHKTIFRANGRDDQQGAIAGAMLARHHAGKRIALIHDKSAYGKGLVDQAAATLKSKGIAPTQAASINAGDKDFAALVTRLKADRIDVVYFGGYHAELGQMVRQAREQQFNGAFVAGEAMSTSEYYAITGAAGDGTLFTYAPAVKERASARDAEAAIRARGGNEPDNFAFYYYAAVEALAGAIAEAKSDRPDAIAEALRRGTFATVIGDAAFDAKGDLKAPEWVFYEWRGGRYALAKLD
jgi:branched-chain amino acid transport system substrate-binding protein